MKINIFGPLCYWGTVLTAMLQLGIEAWDEHINGLKISKISLASDIFCLQVSLIIIGLTSLLGFF